MGELFTVIRQVAQGEVWYSLIALFTYVEYISLLLLYLVNKFVN